MDSLLNKATTNDDNPTPGYVFVELTKMLHGDAGLCEKMSDSLYKRLQRSEPAVKWKTLTVMKLVAKSSRPEFRRALQRGNEAVKACLQFKGPPDPLRGDEPYRKVKDAAKEALEAMFFEGGSGPTGGGAAGMSGRITGMSGGGVPPPSAFPPTSSSFPPANPSRTGGGGGFSTALPGQPGYDPNSPMHQAPQTSGTMESLGNYDPNKDKTLVGGMFDRVKSAFTTSTTVPPSGAAAAGGRPTNDFTTGGGGGGGGGGGNSRFPPPNGPTQGGGGGGGGYNPGAAGAGQGFGASSGDRRAGQPGGGWGSSSSFSSAPSSGSGGGGGGDGGGGGGFGRRGVLPAGGANNNSSVGGGVVGGGVTDGAFERGVIEDLTSAGGLRAVPDKEKLEAFLKGPAKTLEVGTLGRLLDERLGFCLRGEGDVVSAKAIAVCEAVGVSGGGGGGATALRTHLCNNCDVLLEILEAGEGVKVSLRQGAFKALKALGVTGVEEPAGLFPPNQSSSSSFAVPTTTFSNFTSTQQQQQQQQAAPSSGFDLLGIVTPTPAPPAPTPAFSAPPVNVFQQQQQQQFLPQAAPAPAAAPLVDMFGGMSLTSSAPVAAAAAPSAGGFGNFAPAPTTTAAPMFAANPAPAAPTPAAPAPAVGGAPGGGAGALVALNAQIQALTVAMATSPTAAAALLPQLLELQRQQSAIIASLSGVAPPPAAAALAPAPTAAAAMPFLQHQQQQQPLVGGFSFAAAPPPAAPQTMGPVGLNGLPLTRGIPSAAPVAAPTAPKAYDPFDFASKDLFSQ